MIKTIFRLKSVTPWQTLFAGMLLAGLLIQPVQAIEAHKAEQLEFSENLTLSSLLDLTVERHPMRVLMMARSATADAEEKYARRWTPDTSSLTAFHMSDSALDDTGAYENEVALSFPMWLPGERKAQSRLSDVLADSQVSGEAGFRWLVSGQLRQQLWQLKLSARQWQLAVEQEQRMGKVMAQVTLFAEAGELSRADQLAAMEEYSLLKGETMLLEAEYMDATRMYNSFTGQHIVPAQFDEALSEATGISEDHPALRRALDELAESSALTEVVRKRSTSRPSVDVFWRGFRGDARSPTVNALGVGFAVPLGRSPRREPEVARAYELYAERQAGLLQLKRELELQLHESEHYLHVTGEQLENSNAIMKAAMERYELDKMAFELGEFSTSEWLRRLSRLKQIERSHELLLIQRGAAIAAYNQAVGESL